MKFTAAQKRKRLITRQAKLRLQLRFEGMALDGYHDSVRVWTTRVAVLQRKLAVIEAALATKG